MDDESIAESFKRPTEFVRNYFSYDSTTKRSKCKIEGCSTSLSGKHTGNLEKHVMRNHPLEAQVISGHRMNYDRQKRLGNEVTESSETSKSERHVNDSFSSFSSSASSSSPGSLRNAPKRRKKNSIPIQMDIGTLLDACVEMVTVNGRPFSILEDSGMRRILDPIVSSLGDLQSNVSINREKVVDEVRSEASRVRNSIRAEVQGRLVSVKVDTATRLDRSVLGINIQFCKGGKVVLRNLCVKELHSRHTAENLKKEIIDVLAEFGVTPAMVYSITTDNAANMVKTVKLISDSASNGSGSYYSEDSVVEEKESQFRNDDKFDGEHTDFTEGEKWETSTFATSPSCFKQDGVFGLRCAAHTLQLAVTDALKDDGNGEYTAAINAARTVCKKLRTPTIACLITTLHHSKPLLDCPTRWHSTLDMIESLLKLKEVLDNELCSGHLEREICLSDTDWRKLEEIVAALKPAKIATKKMQSEQLLVGDFLKVWLQCKADTEKLNSALGRAVLAAMERREITLMGCPAILCGIFMDPRWHIMLSAEQRELAEAQLVVIWRRLQAVSGTDPSTGVADGNGSRIIATAESPMHSEEEDSDPLEKLLRTRERQMMAELTTPMRRDIKELLRSMSKKPRLPHSENLLLFWERQKHETELYQLATTVLGVPMTQVSVERLFSHLRFILNYLRGRMRSTLVNDILLVRCNRIFRQK